MRKILMVCLGNICRSPLAEGIMRQKIEAQQLDWEVDSAGTGAWHIGQAPDHRSIATAKKYGIDLSGQRAAQFTTADFAHFDVIYVMDSSNYQDVVKLAQNESQKQKVQLIMNEVTPGRNTAVPDPYWDDQGFEKVFKMLETACAEIVKKYGKD